MRLTSKNDAMRTLVCKSGSDSSPEINQPLYVVVDEYHAIDRREASRLRGTMPTRPRRVHTRARTGRRAFRRRPRRASARSPGREPEPDDADHAALRGSFERGSAT